MLRYPTAFCRGAAKILLSSVRTAETILPTTVYMRECFFSLTGKNALRKGRLSCYINTAGDDRPKYRVSDKNIDGYKHLGRLVLTLRNYEV